MIIRLSQSAALGFKSKVVRTEVFATSGVENSKFVVFKERLLKHRVLGKYGRLLRVAYVPATGSARVHYLPLNLDYTPVEGLESYIRFEPASKYSRYAPT